MAFSRAKTLVERFGIAKTTLQRNFVLHDPSDPYVAGLNAKIPRLTPFALGEKAVAYSNAEVDALEEALLELGAKPAKPQSTTRSRVKTKTHQAAA